MVGMRRRALLAAPAVLAAAAARAQAPDRLHRIGVLIDGSAPHPLPEALRSGMKDRGYVEGKTIAFEVRYADGQPARGAEQARQLVQAGVDALVAHFTTSVRAAMAATSTVPIIMAPAGAPLETGLVASLSRPGGNVTGVTNMSVELGGRRLQILKDMIPSLGRVAALVSPEDAFTRPLLANLEAAAVSGGLQLDPVAIGGPAEFEVAFAAMVERRVGAVVIAGFFNSNRRELIALAARHRLPTLWFDRPATEAGGLVSLSAGNADMFRLVCQQLDKVLRGARPGELPVEQPAIFELVLNLKTARTLGITVPQSVLVQADELLE
jgi:putative tryptophan/tyrosine transport system substrate-binding protein